MSYQSYFLGNGHPLLPLSFESLHVVVSACAEIVLKLQFAVKIGWIPRSADVSVETGGGID